jgi:AcrR family transcriptional regulator
MQKRGADGMPRIRESTIREHREHTMTALLDSAEHILKTEGNAALTPARVSEGAGVARNTIYRYVRNMDDLRRLVLHRHLPSWNRALQSGLRGISDPRDIIAAWVRINLEQSSIHGHTWMMGLPESTADARTPPAHRAGDLPEDARPARTGNESDNSDRPGFHNDVDEPIVEAWTRLAPRSARTGIVVTKGLVSSGMRLLDCMPQDGETGRKGRAAVIADIERCARAAIAALCDGDGVGSGDAGPDRQM